MGPRTDGAQVGAELDNSRTDGANDLLLSASAATSEMRLLRESVASSGFEASLENAARHIPSMGERLFCLRKRLARRGQDGPAFDQP